MPARAAFPLAPGRVPPGLPEPGTFLPGRASGLLEETMTSLRPGGLPCHVGGGRRGLAGFSFLLGLSRVPHLAEPGGHLRAGRSLFEIAALWAPEHPGLPSPEQGGGAAGHPLEVAGALFPGDLRLCPGQGRTSGRGPGLERPPAGVLSPAVLSFPSELEWLTRPASLDSLQLCLSWGTWSRGKVAATAERQGLLLVLVNQPSSWCLCPQHPKSTAGTWGSPQCRF